MKHTKSKIIWLVTLVLSLGPLLIFAPQASAAQLTSRSVTLSSSSAASSNATTTYTFGFTTATTATFQSFQAQACTTASGSCTTPTGFSQSSSTFTSSTLSGTWSISTATSGALRASATSASSTTSGTAKNMVIGTVQNPTTANATFFMRVTLYSDTGYTTAVDTGVVAASTASLIDVSASVDETLTFCTGTSGISTDCSAPSGTSVGLGTITATSTGAQTSLIGVATNAGSGYSITINGTTLTSGGNTISALASQTASSQGSEQFGVNLVANATPSVGANPSGSGSATPTANYNTADQFRFVTGDSIASKNSADAFRLFTVSYIANISSATEPGTYTTTITYICTATY